jgi:hypothetical protein
MIVGMQEAEAELQAVEKEAAKRQTQPASDSKEPEAGAHSWSQKW